MCYAFEPLACGEARGRSKSRDDVELVGEAGSRWVVALVRDHRTGCLVSRPEGAAGVVLDAQTKVRRDARCGLPDTWRETIANVIADAVGKAPVFVIGSRASGEGFSWSDCDISVVLGSRRILTGARRLQVVGSALSKQFGVPVTVNPIPKLVFKRARHNLYVLKVRVEGVRLDASANERGEVVSGEGKNGAHLTTATDWYSHSPRARRAEVSYLLTAVHTLLQGIDPEKLASGAFDAREEATLGKARAQVAQCLILTRGQYVPNASEAVMRAESFGLLPAESSGVEGFLQLRKRLLEILGPTPISVLGIRTAARDMQYVALSTLRGRPRWPLLGRERGIEAKLAAASLCLLGALSRDQPSGYDKGLVLRASLLLPGCVRPQSQTFKGLRDAVLSEWSSAQPLVGVIP